MTHLGAPALSGAGTGMGSTSSTFVDPSLQHGQGWVKRGEPEDGRSVVPWFRDTVAGDATQLRGFTQPSGVGSALGSDWVRPAERG